MCKFVHHGLIFHSLSLPPSSPSHSPPPSLFLSLSTAVSMSCLPIHRWHSKVSSVYIHVVRHSSLHTTWPLPLATPSLRVWLSRADLSSIVLLVVYSCLLQTTLASTYIQHCMPPLFIHYINFSMISTVGLLFLCRFCFSVFGWLYIKGSYHVEIVDPYFEFLERPIKCISCTCTLMTGPYCIA